MSPTLMSEEVRAYVAYAALGGVLVSGMAAVGLGAAFLMEPRWWALAGAVGGLLAAAVLTAVVEVLVGDERGVRYWLGVLLGNPKGWGVVALIALSLSIALIVFGDNRPWSPIRGCTGATIRMTTNFKPCLVRMGADGRIRPHASLEGETLVWFPAEVDTNTLAVTPEHVGEYTFFRRPWAHYLLLVVAGVGGMVWAGGNRRRRIPPSK